MEQRFDVTLRNIASASKREPIDTSLCLQEVRRACLNQAEWDVSVVAVRQHREVCELGHSDVNVFDRCRELGRNHIAQGCSDLFDLFAHAPGHIDQEEHIRRGDASEETDLDQLGRILGWKFNADVGRRRNHRRIGARHIHR